jgi:hypothetical protein
MFLEEETITFHDVERLPLLDRSEVSSSARFFGMPL